MARRVIVQRERYRIEFETSGSGRYYLMLPDDQKGPYNTEDDAKRAAVAWLEERVSRPGEQLERQMREDDDALRRAKRRDQQRFGVTPEEAQEEVDDLISRARRGAAEQRARNQRIRLQRPEKNAAPEGDSGKFRFHGDDD